MQLQIGITWGRDRRVGSGRATLRHRRRKECSCTSPASESAGGDWYTDLGCPWTDQGEPCDQGEQGMIRLRRASVIATLSCLAWVATVS